MRNRKTLVRGYAGTIGYCAQRRAMRNQKALAGGRAVHRKEPCATWGPSRGGAPGPLRTVHKGGPCATWGPSRGGALGPLGTVH